MLVPGAKDAHEDGLCFGSPFASIATTGFAIDHCGPNGLLCGPVRCFDVGALEEEEQRILVA